MKEVDELKERIIPENVFQGKRVAGLFKKRNCAEGIIGLILVFVLVAQIPFVLRVRWIVSICIGITVFLLISIGIKNQSLSEFLQNTVEIKKYKIDFHYRRLNYVEGNVKSVVSNGKISTFRKSKEVAKKLWGKEN